MKKLFVILFATLLSINCVFSQKNNTSTAIGEEVLSKSAAEKRRKLKSERNKLSNQLSELYNLWDKAEAKTPAFYENVKDIKVLENAIGVLENVRVQVKNFMSRAKRLQELDNFFNAGNTKRIETLKAFISRIEKKQKLADSQITKLNQSHSKKKKYTTSLENLNTQLELVTKEANNLEDINTTYDISFEDILTKKNSNKKPNNQLDDSFLNNDSNAETKGGNLDFLTKETVIQKNKSNWKIDYKNGLQGVINTDTKKVLIPYKKWRVEKYQDGIAKISIDIDSKQICSCRLGNYNASVKEVGYVDEDGRFIDGSRKVISGSFNYQAKLVIAKPGYDANRAKIRDAKEKQECIKKGKQWKIAAKRRYL